jgi:hypothetical protein
MKNQSHRHSESKQGTPKGVSRVTESYSSGQVGDKGQNKRNIQWKMLTCSTE